LFTDFPDVAARVHDVRSSGPESRTRLTDSTGIRVTR
jgi:hypothetical protein